MSDLCKSTDSLELKSLLEAVQEEIIEQYRNNHDFLDSVIYGMDMDDAFFFIGKITIEKMKKNLDQMLFGVCFSEEGDLLGQWREYAEKGTGLAIGFDANWFQELCKNDDFRFPKVTYGYKKENRDIIKEYATSIYDELLRVMIEERTKDIVEGLYGASYMMELDRFQKLLPTGMDFMVRNGKIIPYLDLKFDLDEDNLPIKKIIIGPNCKVDELDIWGKRG